MSLKLRKKRARKRRRINRRLEIQAADVPGQLQLSGEAEIDIQAADEEGNERLPKFTLNAYNGGRMRPAEFFDDVVVDLQGMRNPSGNRPVLLGHDRRSIVGHTTSVNIARSIRAEGVISGTGAAAQEVTGNARNGFGWQVSIGASIEKARMVEAGETVRVNGRQFRGPFILATKTTLKEISFTPIGADSTTSARVAAEAANHNQGARSMDFTKWLEANGFDHDELSDGQRTILKAAWEAEQAAGNGGASTTTQTVEADEAISEVRAELLEELRQTRELRESIQADQRAAAIRDICARHENPTMDVDGQQVAIEAHALSQQWDAQRTELEVLRRARPGVPAIHARSHDGDCTLEAMQGAMLIANGVALDSPRLSSPQAIAMGLPSWLRANINDETRQRYMEHAHRYSDMSAVDICAEAIRLGGGTVPSGRARIIEAAFSGSALTDVFTTSVNATLLESYMQAPDTTQDWTSSTDVADFKTNERIRLAKGSDLEKLPRGKEAAHHDRSDVKEEYKIARYAKQFVVDEQDIIDDNLSALRTFPEDMGAAAARLRPDLVYSILLANDTLADTVALFDNSTHANVQTSAALTEANLKTLIALIELQQDNGVTLNLRASHLIVPSDLKHTAANLISSSLLLYGADDETSIGNQNTINTDENLRLVSEGRLSNGVTDPDTGTVHSGSTSTHYLAAAMGHTIEVGYLRGTGRAPQVRSFVLTQGKWGLGWDINMDIGAKALDFRSLARSTA